VTVTDHGNGRPPSASREAGLVLDTAMHPAGNGTVFAADLHRAGSPEIAELLARQGAGSTAAHLGS
jgi:hypothetical protein